jgi:hypothetical protein
MNRTRRLLLFAVGIPALLLGLAAPATADPNRAPNLFIGSASSTCSSAGPFLFVVTISNSESITWSPLFFSRPDDDATALFIPASYDFEVFTTPEGDSFRFTAQKGAAPGPDTCHVKARAPEGLPMLFGDMTGQLIVTG